eukprot:scaffold3196_cov92-Isochrysis_galbana.AAC.1
MRLTEALRREREERRQHVRHPWRCGRDCGGALEIVGHDGKQDQARPDNFVPGALEDDLGGGRFGGRGVGAVEGQKVGGGGAGDL